MMAHQPVLLAAALTTLSTGSAVPHGGGPCQSDWNCSLGGSCNRGSCACDVWFTGPHCALLNLARAKVPNGLNLNATGTTTWGGHAVTTTGTNDTSHSWIGHFSLITGGCTLGAYRTNSESAFATSAAVDGPYELADMADPDAVANAAVAPASHCTQIKRHPSGEYHLWHILPGNNARPTSCKHDTLDLSARGDGGPRTDGPSANPGGSFSQNLYVHTAPTPTGPWGAPRQIIVAPLANGTTAAQSWCSAPYYFPNGTALLMVGGQACPPGWKKPGSAGGGGCLWVAVADSWEGPYRQWKAEPATHPENEDPAIFEDHRGNLHMLTNVNTGHNRCAAGVPCGGHAFSQDGLTWSDTHIGAFGPNALVDDGTKEGVVQRLGYVERPQVAQVLPGAPPVALFIAAGYTHRAYTWAQKFCTNELMAAGACGFMGGLPLPPPPPSPSPSPVFTLAHQGAFLGFVNADGSAGYPCRSYKRPADPFNCPNCCNISAVSASSAAAAAAQWVSTADGELESHAHPGRCANVDYALCKAGQKLWLGGCGWNGDGLQFAPDSTPQLAGSEVASGVLRFRNCNLCVTTSTTTGRVQLGGCDDAGARWNRSVAGSTPHERAPPPPPPGAGAPPPSPTSRCEPATNPGYSVVVVDRALGPGGGSVVSKANGTSLFNYNMNAAYFPSARNRSSSATPDGLVVRVGNTPNYGPTGLAVVRRVGDPAASMSFETVDSSKMIVPCPAINATNKGRKTAAAPCADDPRIVYRSADDTYYMTYGNDSGLDKSLSGRVQWIASSKTPWEAASWAFHGPVTRDFKLTSGASLILRDDAGPNATHFVILALENTAGGLVYGTSTDLRHWVVNDTAWCKGRRGMFDQKGVAAGPQAERLSDGNYLYLYSIDNVRSCQSASCGHGCGVDCSAPGASKGCYGRCTDGRCALGWMILDKDDPTRVIARANQTLLYAELPFETTGTTGANATGPLQTPWVVFTDGLQPLGNDEFVVWYGGGDTVVAAARIKVTVPARPVRA